MTRKEDEEGRPVIVLETINPLDMTPADLQELADALVDGLDGLNVEVRYEQQYGSGVTWNEVLHLWLPSAEFMKDAAYTYLIQQVTTWLASRFKRRGNEKRPKILIVHDADGIDLEELGIDSPSMDPRPRPRAESFPRKRPGGRHRAP